MPSIPSRPESVTKTVNDTDDSEAATASIQSLRAELSSFKFSGSPPMGLRRSPRNTFKYDANDDVLPTFSTDPAVPQSSHESSARRSMRRPKQKTSAMKSDMGRASGSTDVTALTPPHKRASPQAGKAEVIGRKISAASGQQKLKMKALKVKRGFAPPQMYAHLQPLHDYLQEELDVLFCGINPGEKSAQIGHHFANPTNHFWRCLAGSELTDRLLSPTEDFTLPGKHNLGLTNLVERPSKQEAELAPSEFSAGVPALLYKLARFRPRIVCFVGKGIWEAFARAVHSQADAPIPSKKVIEGSSVSKREKRGSEPFEYGIQPLKAVHSVNANASVLETLFFVMPSTSGRVTSHQLPEKTQLFRFLKGSVEQSKQGNIDTASMTVIPLPELPGNRGDSSSS